MAIGFIKIVIFVTKQLVKVILISI